MVDSSVTDFGAKCIHVNNNNSIINTDAGRLRIPDHTRHISYRPPRPDNGRNYETCSLFFRAFVPPPFARRIIYVIPGRFFFSSQNVKTYVFVTLYFILYTRGLDPAARPITFSLNFVFIIYTVIHTNMAG